MVHFNQGRFDKAAFPPTPLSRKDYLSAQLVEVALVIQSLQGTHHAAEYLRTRRVAMDVAMRVLLHPKKRRSAARH